MTTTPETIAELKRLLAEHKASAERSNFTACGCGFWGPLPSLLADIEILREALQLISLKHPGYGGSGEIARAALAATEVQP